MNRIARLLLLSMTLLSPNALAETVFTSTPAQTTMIELFTSEGCSSCPPAEAWLARYLDDPALWQSIIPVAFHVDYWDRLGWKDPYAAASHSQRQRQYRHEGRASSVYTPGIFVNGEEYRGFFNPFQRDQPVPASDAAPGVLTLEISKSGAALTYAEPVPAKAHIAFLGMDVEQHIRRGENAGRRLTHQFVVLDVVSRPGNSSWQFAGIEPPKGADAVVAWISVGNQAPIQAVGGLLPIEGE